MLLVFTRMSFRPKIQFSFQFLSLLFCDFHSFEEHKSGVLQNGLQFEFFYFFMIRWRLWVWGKTKTQMECPYHHRDDVKSASSTLFIISSAVNLMIQLKWSAVWNFSTPKLLFFLSYIL